MCRECVMSVCVCVCMCVLCLCIVHSSYMYMTLIRVHEMHECTLINVM